MHKVQKIDIDMIDIDIEIRDRYFHTVKPVYSEHLRFLQKVSAITRCPLYRVLDFLGKKDNKNEDESSFSYDASKQYK